ncbi:hypothetical protein BUALT_Bualt16G0059300 [Buddleja alternifolia]|uniref:Uncharacterized protein n=1 Tax=Buddleja alternifolia TaxID=168488 RepID=A0AAV6WK98_9LAMI|nr:hypothetical protein BUALT_Bualt16G0059300 [Buddleja alternifolia]
MASGMLPFRPVVVRAGINSAEDRKPDQGRKSSSSPKWWSPLFGFSSEPDYIESDEKKIKPEVDRDPGPAKTRFNPGSFTEEKARQLRRMTNDATSSHESMYHSVIASRLASDFSDRTAA